MADIPKSIRIAGIEFEVIEVSRPGDLLVTSIGSISYDNSRITIANHLSPVRKRKTLLHEVIHGVDAHFAGGKLTEDQVVALEDGLYALFMDNPGLADYLFGGADGRRSSE